MPTYAYRHNHYVPVWYQRRFLSKGESKLYYLDLKPELRNQSGHTWRREALRHLGPKNCFAQDDLYTTKWGRITNTQLEEFFFQDLDQKGASSLSYISSFPETSRIDPEAFNTFVRFMSVQKLRTPKGLAWLRQATGAETHNFTLMMLQRLQQLYCATWTDCVWQIADASTSKTKFIVSDHPVTVYNRDCFPSSKSCHYPRDPDIRMVGTQTIFPLSLNKALFLTNLSWVRDPYQSPTRQTPNQRLFRTTMFKFTDIQVGRILSEEEVREVNFVLKCRASRYVASPNPDWLFPERYLTSTHWRKLGDGYLFMPDPRHVYMGGEIYVGYNNGRSEAFGPYGHRPWEDGFKDALREQRETKTLLKFQAEWSSMFGPTFRGVSDALGGRRTPTAGSDYHAHLLARDKEELAKPGERARRRHLRRSG